MKRSSSKTEADTTKRKNIQFSQNTGHFYAAEEHKLQIIDPKSFFCELLLQM